MWCIECLFGHIYIYKRLHLTCYWQVVKHFAIVCYSYLSVYLSVCEEMRDHSGLIHPVPNDLWTFPVFVSNLAFLTLWIILIATVVRCHVLTLLYMTLVIVIIIVKMWKYETTTALLHYCIITLLHHYVTWTFRNLILLTFCSVETRQIVRVTAGFCFLRCNDATGIRYNPSLCIVTSLHYMDIRKILLSQFPLECILPYL